MKISIDPELNSQPPSSAGLQYRRRSQPPPDSLVNKPLPLSVPLPFPVLLSEPLPVLVRLPLLLPLPYL